MAIHLPDGMAARSRKHVAISPWTIVVDGMAWPFSPAAQPAMPSLPIVATSTMSPLASTVNSEKNPLQGK